MTRMFTIAGERLKTYNPIVGCSHHCIYCYARRLSKRLKCTLCKSFIPHLHPERLKKFPKSKHPVFLCDMSDMFAENIPSEWISSVLRQVARQIDQDFLVLTKNPRRWFEFAFPPNLILGVTIESNLDYPDVSKAPLQSNRLYYAISYSRKHSEQRIFVSIEPILSFTESFSTLLKWISPQFIYIGYDNWNCHLPEPSGEQTDKLISELEAFTEVRIKTMRCVE